MEMSIFDTNAMKGNEVLYRKYFNATDVSLKDGKKL